MSRLLYISKKTGIDPNAFITRWNLPSGNFTLPTYSNTTAINCIVDWGDGSATSTITSYSDTDRVHNYASAGVYYIKITGTLPYFRPSQYSGTKGYLTDIIQWGNVGTKKLQYSYYTCVNLSSIPNKPFPAVSGVSDTEFYNGTFYGCTSLNIIPASCFDDVVVGNAGTNYFAFCFRGCTAFYGAVPESWNTFSDAAGTDCFMGCTNASNYAIIPAAWK